MSRHTFLVALIVTIACATTQAANPRNISIFCDHIEDVARQRGISFTEAAASIRDLGYTGVDVRVTMDLPRQHTLDSLGFGHASAIAEINFAKGPQPQRCRQAIDFATSRGYSRLHLVPGFIPAEADKSLIDSIYARTAAFAGQAAADGIEVLIEDYDSTDSPTYDTAALDAFYAAAPALGHVLDTGNFIYCGDDPLKAMQHFRSRLRHVHLKDRIAPHDKASPALGTGILQLNEIVFDLISTGYDGWFTVEHFGVDDMLGQAAISIRNLNAAIDRAH